MREMRMKIRELIEILNTFDQDKTIVIDSFDPYMGRNLWFDIFSVEETPDIMVDSTDTVVLMNRHTDA